MISGNVAISRIDKKRELDCQHALRILFVGLSAGLHFIYFAFVDDQLAILIEGHAESVERTRRRTFKIHTDL